MAATNRVHYYHADVNALGGYLERPIEQIIPLQVPLSLSPSGGYGSARAENFQLAGVISYKSAYTQVSGALSKKEGHGWVTLATSVIEGLNVLNVITADRICAQISTEHPLLGNYPSVTFLGTSFENLKVSGCPLDVTLDLDTCVQGNGRGYPGQSLVSDNDFLNKVAGQYSRMVDKKGQPEWVKDKSVPGWIPERYCLDKPKDGERCSVLCTVVEEISGKFPGRPFGNVLEIPEFGRVFLGELLVDCSSFQLIMLRMELGCSGHGQIAAAPARANGGTYPPS